MSIDFLAIADNHINLLCRTYFRSETHTACSTLKAASTVIELTNASTNWRMKPRNTPVTHDTYG